jgi:hypothetical protein
MNELNHEEKLFSSTMIAFFDENDYDTQTEIFDESMFSIGLEILN